MIQASFFIWMSNFGANIEQKNHMKEYIKQSLNSPNMNWCCIRNKNERMHFMLIWIIMISFQKVESRDCAEESYFYLNQSNTTILWPFLVFWLITNAFESQNRPYFVKEYPKYSNWISMSSRGAVKSMHISKVLPSFHL